MAKEWTLYVFALLTGYAYIVEATCRIENQITSCQYTVVCEVHSGSAPNLNCDREPNVTFQITKSNTAYLTAGFFGATNFDSRVRAFTAINNTWRSIAPSSLRYYPKTLQMDLSGNQIEEIQDEAFKNLFIMKILNVSSNLIETLYSKSLFTFETEGSYIEILDLSNNLLKTIASDAFHRCPKLRELYLQNNNIANLEDNVFSNLQNLTLLFFQNNKLTELNMTLTNLKGLKDLDLSNNAITKLAGFETNRLISLERVNMSFNEIQFIESNCFNQAFNLENLDLRNNKIKSPITNIMFLNNGKLSYLNLYNNNITNIQENSFQHNILTYINLEKNFISGEITQPTFAGLQRVKDLNLFKQNITSLKANAFKGMTSLVHLNLSSNNIDFIDHSSFKITTLMAVLDLGYNKIQYLNFLTDALMNLTEIYLNNNNISIIPAHTFINQTLLYKLDISMNKILTIEQYSLPLKNLQILKISGNPLTVVKSNVLSPAQYLRYLDLSSLNITRVENMAFINLPVLARLNLSYNAIEFIGPKNFFNLSNIYSLDLSNNRLLNLQLNGSVMEHLNALYLNNNNLSSVDGITPNSTEIMYIDISHNNISELAGAAFETLKGLRVLKASNNKIRAFNNPQINLLSKLKDIDLSSNRISNIDFSFYKDLVRIDISHNSLNFLNNTFLQDLEQLQVLNICYNNISVLSPGVFQNAESLKVLNISYNNLSYLRYGSLMGLHNTKVIDISGNNITEMDVDVFHECRDLTRLIIDYNHVKYLDVEHLINIVPKLTSLSIGGNPLDCKEIVRNIRHINRTIDRSIEITSIHKIFHEDNVYGIRCGDVDTTTAAVTVTSTSMPVTTTAAVIDTSTSMPPIYTSSSALFIWCSVLTLVLVLLGAFVIWKRLYRSTGSYSQTSMRLRRSVELNGSDFQSDLLN